MFSFEKSGSGERREQLNAEVFKDMLQERDGEHAIQEHVTILKEALEQNPELEFAVSSEVADSFEKIKNFYIEAGFALPDDSELKEWIKDVQQYNKRP